MSAASSASAAPSNRAFGNVSAEIQSIQDSILKVEGEIEEVKAALKTPEIKEDPAELKHWRGEQERLEIKEQQLRAEKLILLQQSGTFGVLLLSFFFIFSN